MDGWRRRSAWGAIVLWLALPQTGHAQAVAQGASLTPSKSDAIGRLREAAISVQAGPAYGGRLFEFKPSPELLEIQELLVRQGAAIVPSLLPLLQEPDLRVREAAADVLERIAGEGAQTALISYSLAHLLDKPRLTKRIEGPGYFRLVKLRLVALPAITQAYDQEALKKDPDSHHQIVLVRAAAAMPDRAGLPLIRRALWRSCPTVAATAAVEMGKLGGPTALSELTRFLEPHRFVCRQIENLSGGDPCVAGTHALALLGTPDAVEPLLKLLLRLGPDRTPPSWVALGRISCQSEAHRVIEHLTGQKMNRDIERIRAWVDAYHRSRRPPGQ